MRMRREKLPGILAEVVALLEALHGPDSVTSCWVLGQFHAVTGPLMTEANVSHGAIACSSGPTKVAGMVSTSTEGWIPRIVSRPVGRIEDWFFAVDHPAPAIFVCSTLCRPVQSESALMWVESPLR